MRSLCSGFLVLVIGCAALWWGTDGLRAFTAEEARRLQIAENPRSLSSPVMVDARGKTVRFADLRGKLVLVEFIYTRCPDICYALGATFESLQEKIVEGSLGQEVALLSISFDPINDGAEQLRSYGARLGADAEIWQIVRLGSSASLKALLDTFEVVVIPDSYGGFEHNAAIHLVDRQGKLARILDYERPDRVMEIVESWL